MVDCRRFGRLREGATGSLARRLRSIRRQRRSQNGRPDVPPTSPTRASGVYHRDRVARRNSGTGDHSGRRRSRRWSLGRSGGLRLRAPVPSSTWGPWSTTFANRRATPRSTASGGGGGMTAVQRLLGLLAAHRITVSVHGERLRLTGPRGAISPEVRAAADRVK